MHEYDFEVQIFTGRLLLYLLISLSVIHFLQFTTNLLIPRRIHTHFVAVSQYRAISGPIHHFTCHSALSSARETFNWFCLELVPVCSY